MDTAATINLSDILGGDHFYPGDGLPELAVFPVRLPFEDYPDPVPQVAASGCLV